MQPISMKSPDVAELQYFLCFCTTALYHLWSTVTHPEILDLSDAYRLTHFGCLGHAEKNQLYSITSIIVFSPENMYVYFRRQMFFLRQNRLAKTS